MQKITQTAIRKWILFSLVILGLAAAALIRLPDGFRSQAGNKAETAPKGLVERTRSHQEGLENYDIRADKTAFEKMAQFRSAQNRSAAAVADLRDEFVRGEMQLKRRVPTLKIEYNADLRTPEIIAPDVEQGRAFLTEAASGSRAERLRAFLKQNDALIGVEAAQADELKVTADYTNPDGNLSFAHLEQFINGIPVFRGEVKAGFTKNGEIIRVVNNLAPGLDYQGLAADFGDPLDAVKFAASHANTDLSRYDLARSASAADDLKVTFGTGDSATVAEKMYFPTEPGVAVPAWRVLIWQPVNAFYVIVDAQTGTLLWRKNITEDQTQAATYSVYRNANAMIDVADSPFPLTPGPIAPNGTQGIALSRVAVTRVGNEAPYDFNNLGWLTDGATKTDGNAVQAGLDRDGTDGVDANSEAVSANRVFTFSYTPFNPNSPGTGEAPVAVPQTYPGSAFQQGTTTQLFYTTNWYHDELYRLGFTEAARNFQHDNFGRGGLGGDRIRGEGQDSSGTNNANFSTPADGTRGRMQMYVWTAPAPDVDGNLDADVVIHELTHGTSNRLHGNGSGLSTNMARGMGEGWSDFYAHALLSEPTDPINGIYTTGGYDTYGMAGVGTNNYYYGIRRFPKAVMSFTGGPNNRPHNPLTFADIDGSQINLTNGAFNPAFTGTADQVHNAGEVWSSALWEVRAKYITRLGWAVGNRRVLQYVTDGMKLAPLAPTFLQERDAIIAAAQASLPAPQASADVADLWAGFAIRGMGASAEVLISGSGTGNTRVIEAFDLPNLSQLPVFTFSDAAGDGDGTPEPGETLSLTIPLLNNTGNDAADTTLQITGGGAANYGTILNSATSSQTVSYTIPANTPCGSAVNLNFNVNSSLGPATITRQLIVGSPVATFTENFDALPAPAFPAGWTTEILQNGIGFVTAAANPDTAPNAAFALDPTTVGGGTNLTSPVIAITASAATVSFRNRFDTEPGWDGGVLEISIGGGPFQDILVAGGRFIEGGYNGTLGAGTNNPLSNRRSWSGNSGGYLTTTAQLPAAAAGQNVQLRWRFGADNNTAPPGGGWNIDSIRVNGNYNCAFTPQAVKSRADFDGDGKTDLSVFRPADGNWYLNRSTAGFTAIQFGTATDLLTPGDFDGDGKADISVFRPASGSWFRLNSSNNTLSVAQFGVAGDIPVAGDYDGDGKADISVYRPSAGAWFRLNSGSGQFIAAQFGTAGDVPLVGDFDGDLKADLTVFRPAAGAWYRLESASGQFVGVNFGLATDLLVPADYDGDNKDDIAVFRPSNGTWYLLNRSNGQFAAVQFGAGGDRPAPGDYDGDGRDDLAVYRAGTWYLSRSSAGFAAFDFGAAADRAVPGAYLP